MSHLLRLPLEQPARNQLLELSFCSYMGIVARGNAKGIAKKLTVLAMAHNVFSAPLCQPLGIGRRPATVAYA